MAEQDKIQREKVEYANNAENHINNIEKNISEYKDQLPADEVGYYTFYRQLTRLLRMVFFLKNSLFSL